MNQVVSGANHCEEQEVRDFYCFPYTSTTLKGLPSPSKPFIFAVNLLPSSPRATSFTPISLPSRMVVMTLFLSSIFFVVAETPAGGPPSRYVFGPPSNETVYLPETGVPSFLVPLNATSMIRSPNSRIVMVDSFDALGAVDFVDFAASNFHVPTHGL